MKITHPAARVSLAFAVAASLVATQNLFAEDAEQLPATKHQAESVKGVIEAETPAPQADKGGMPVTPHQQDALEDSGKGAVDSASLRLTGDQVVPAVTTSASGSGSIAIGADQSVSGSITTSGVVVTAAHIHTAAKGSNGPVIISLTKISDNVWAVPAGTTLTEAQYASYKAGNLYVNVHSDVNEAGEIRAQLNP